MADRTEESAVVAFCVHPTPTTYAGLLPWAGRAWASPWEATRTAWPPATEAEATSPEPGCEPRTVEVRLRDGSVYREVDRVESWRGFGVAKADGKEWAVLAHSKTGVLYYALAPTGIMGKLTRSQTEWIARWCAQRFGDLPPYEDAVADPAAVTTYFGRVSEALNDYWTRGPYAMARARELGATNDAKLQALRARLDAHALRAGRGGPRVDPGPTERPPMTDRKALAKRMLTYSSTDATQPTIAGWWVVPDGEGWAAVASDGHGALCVPVEGIEPGDYDMPPAAVEAVEAVEALAKTKEKRPPVLDFIRGTLSTFRGERVAWVTLPVDPWRDLLAIASMFKPLAPTQGGLSVVLDLRNGLLQAHICYESEHPADRGVGVIGPWTLATHDHLPEYRTAIAAEYLGRALASVKPGEHFRIGFRPSARDMIHIETARDESATMPRRL